MILILIAALVLPVDLRAKWLAMWSDMVMIWPLGARQMASLLEMDHD